MQKLMMRLGALVVGGGLTALVVAGAPALASTTHHAGTRHTSSSVTGPEVASGMVTGQPALANNIVIPLTLSGLVVTTDKTFALGSGTSKTHEIKTPAGNLLVEASAKPTQSQTENKTTCQETFTEDVQFTVLGSKSTGSFAGSSGPGAAQIYFSATAKRYTSGSKKGQCDFAGEPAAKGAVATFLASIVLTKS